MPPDINLLRNLLLGLLAIPVAAAVLCAVLGNGRAKAVRWVALWATVLLLASSAFLAHGYRLTRKHAPPPENATTFSPEIVPGAVDYSTDPAAPHRTTWQLLPIGNLGSVDFYLGLDGLNIWLVLLTAILMFSSVLVSWTAITERVNEYYAWLLLLGAAMFGVFLAFDIILFYVFFELTLVPLFFLIGIWGGPERRLAARKFFIYTLTGSLVTLLGLLAIVMVCFEKTPEPIPGLPLVSPRLTFSVPELVKRVHEFRTEGQADREFWQTFQFWVFLALVAGFAIKVPMFPVHTWLPLAHVEAPTAGSVLLAGVLLKLGAYGLLRLCLPLVPDACLSVGLPLLGTLAIIGIIYGALCAYAQDDVKKLVAYSSVSHMGFCVLGLFALNGAGIAGGLLQMINHGLSTGALFLLVGMLYERYHTRKMADYGGMGSKLKVLSTFMVLACLSSVGLPGLNGFVGEALVFFGIFARSPTMAILATAGIVLGALYLLTMLLRVFFGPLKEPHHEGHEPIADLNGREILALAPILTLFVVLGVYPQPVLNIARPDIDVIVRVAQPATHSATAQAEEGN